MKFTETTVAQETQYEGIIVKVRRDKARLVNGVIADREVVEHPGGVAVFAIDEQEQVLMVRQFRYPMGEEILELPAGKLEPGEDPRVQCLAGTEGRNRGYSRKRAIHGLYLFFSWNFFRKNLPLSGTGSKGRTCAAG